MRTLKELYDLGLDVRDSDIPKIWKESFEKFIFGSTCQVETNENGSIREFIYYGSDFRHWYYQNKEVIERDIKIDELLDNKKSPLI